MIRDQLETALTADDIHQCLHNAEKSSQLCLQEVSTETGSLTCGVHELETKEKAEGDLIIWLHR